MNENLIIEARDRLQLRTIYLRASNFFMHSDFEPAAAGDHKIQLMITLDSMNIGEFEADTPPPGAKAERSIRGEIAAGVRLMRATSDSEAGNIEASSDVAMVELTAKFRCEYVCDPFDTPSEAAVREYLLHNTKMNVWPYWREFLQSTFARAQLPQITLPLMVNKPMPKAAPEIASQKNST